jgi:uncharacterized membrane protein YbhN (UPF0104 family)
VADESNPGGPADPRPPAPARPAGGVRVRGVQHRRVRPRSLVTAAVAVLLLAFLWKYRSTLAGVFGAISQGVLSLIAVSVLFEAGRIVFHSYAYTRSFKMIGADVPLRLTVPAWFKAIFMNTVLPSGGTSGLAAVIDTARGRGVAVGSATSAALYTQTCYYSAMFVVIVAGLVVMGVTGSLTARDIVLSLFIGIAAAGFLGLLVFGHLAPGLMQRCMRKVESLVAAVCGRLHVRAPKPWADGLVRSFSSAATRIVSRPKIALTVFGVMVVAMACDMFAFMASGAAFGITSAPALLGGYVTALVFNSFSPTPGGVGFVEGLSAAVLAGYGYPGTLALSAVLSYRAFMYWIPFAVGGVMMRVTGAFGTGRQTGEDEGEGAAGAPRRSLRERVLATLSSKTSLRAVVGTLVVAAAAVVEVVASSLPRDPAIVGVLQAYVPALAGTIDPTFVVVVAYLVLLCCAGLVIQDQGCWILSVAALAVLGGVSTLAGNGILAELAVLASLVVLVMWHSSYTRHNFLRRIGRLAWVLLYGVVLAVLYAVVCMEVARPNIACAPDVWQAALMGLQMLTTRVDPELLGDPQVIWLAGSIRAVANTLLLATAFAIALMLVTNWRRWRSPKAVEMRRYNRREARRARERRAADRREASADRGARRAGERRAALERRRALRESARETRRMGRERRLRRRGRAEGLDDAAPGEVAPEGAAQAGEVSAAPGEQGGRAPAGAGGEPRAASGDGVRESGGDAPGDAGRRGGGADV